VQRVTGRKDTADLEENKLIFIHLQKGSVRGAATLRPVCGIMINRESEAGSASGLRVLVVRDQPLSPRCQQSEDAPCRLARLVIQSRAERSHGEAATGYVDKVCTRMLELANFTVDLLLLQRPSMACR
jgi:hypothetical protein